MRKQKCFDCEGEFYARKSWSGECPECGHDKLLELGGFQDSRHRKRYIQFLKSELKGYQDMLADAHTEGRIKWIKKQIQKTERELELRTGGVRTRGSKPDNDKGLEVYSQ